MAGKTVIDYGASAVAKAILGIWKEVERMLK